jgi:hypothetical protein
VVSWTRPSSAAAAAAAAAGVVPLLQVVGNQENDHSLRNLILLQLKKVRVAQGH